MPLVNVTPEGFAVQAIDATSVTIASTRYDHSLWVTPLIAPTAWSVTGVSTLKAEDFQALLLHRPDVIILGTGVTQQFIAPALQVQLLQQGIGLECMNNASACRTYNILLLEGRAALLALIVP